MHSALLARIGSTLEARGIPYMVIGGHAAILYVLPCSETATGIDVDLSLSVSAYEQEALARARAVDLGGVGVRFASVDDVLIHKIVAGRPRDLEDARAILAKMPSLDRPYLQRWLQEFERTFSSPLVKRFRELEAEVHPAP
jgi:predicted nucleotidyltransferase